MFDNMGFGELLIIVLVVLVLFGSKKIPDLAQGLGKGIREIKKALKGEDEKTDDADKKPDDKQVK